MLQQEPACRSAGQCFPCARGPMPLRLDRQLSRKLRVGLQFCSSCGASTAAHRDGSLCTVPDSHPDRLSLGTALGWASFAGIHSLQHRRPFASRLLLLQDPMGSPIELQISCLVSARSLTRLFSLSCLVELEVCSAVVIQVVAPQGACAPPLALLPAMHLNHASNESSNYPWKEIGFSGMGANRQSLQFKHCTVLKMDRKLV